jgi:serine/threonine protein kinase
MDASLDAQRSFVQEMVTKAIYRHPHLLGLLAWGKCGNQVLFYLEPLCQTTLQDELTAAIHNNSPMALGSALKIARGVAKALLFLHSADPPLIHRSLHPSHILLDACHRPFLTGFSHSAIQLREGCLATPLLV